MKRCKNNSFEAGGSLLGGRFAYFSAQCSYFFIDLVSLVFSLAAAYALRFNFSIPELHLALFPFVFSFTIVIELFCYWVFGCFKISHRFFSAIDIPRFLYATGVAAIFFLVCRCVFHDFSIRFYPPISVNLINSVFALASLSLSRWLFRVVNESKREEDGFGFKRIVVVGGGAFASAIVYSIRHDAKAMRKAVGILDIDGSSGGALIQGVPVLGGVDDAEVLLGDTKVDEFIVPGNLLSRERMQNLFSFAGKIGARLLISSGFSSVLGAAAGEGKLRDADISDLLGRGFGHERSSSLKRSYLSGKRVMVTGAGGSIGSEIARQALAQGVRSLILVERNEFALYNIERSLRNKDNNDFLKVYIADVGDAKRIRKIISDESPQIIFHAAAYKHVPLMEENVCEAVKNNFFATQTLAETALECGVREFILLSSDKAVEPSSVMGATKRLCEVLIGILNSKGKTFFSGVRFGNVLGSTGSVVPLFREEIEKGGPVTVTHPDMTRYFMTIPEAVSLTLEASSMGHGGGGFVYILDMGAPLKILRLAEEMIKLSPRSSEEKIPITFIGVRPGEKLEERLLADDEVMEPTSNKEIGKVALSNGGGMFLDEFVSKMRPLVDEGDDDGARQLLMGFCKRKKEDE